MRMMKSKYRVWAALFLLAPLTAIADEPAAKPAATAEAPFGLPKRQHWTTSRITGSPEPPKPYTVERVFPQLSFENPVELTPAPGSDRLFLLELHGKIYSFPNRNDVEKPDLVVDLHKTLTKAGNFYGLEFHPDFEQNRYCYVCYVIGSDIPDGSHVSRFTVSDTDPPTIDPASEKPIITWPSGGHNGGCLKFGHDGYLYVSTGDGTGPNPPDILKTGQDISDLLSSVLRIDVDQAAEGKGYAIPADNPFVDVENARPEIWAYGFRNPWKMNFDTRSGRLWMGDVGWELWEMVYHVRRGGNYGWSAVEGPQPIHTSVDRGPSPISPPTVAHPHSESASITGGHVYHGTRLGELSGKYLYGDFETGKMWAVGYDGERVTSQEEIADTTLKLVCFGTDQKSEFYVVGYTPGEIYRLIPNPAAGSPVEFPHKLSETGLLRSVANHSPAEGVIPYSINAQAWADGATALRYVAIPGDGTVTTKSSPWVFPKDSVLAKTISLDMQPGNAEGRRRIETQILHYDGSAWQGYSYRWNPEQTDATLVAAEGVDVPLDIQDPTAPGGHRQQTWHFSSRTECMRCHNPWAGNALAFNAPQLNRQHHYDAAADNQLRSFAHVDLLDQDLSGPTDSSVLVDPHDPAADQNLRARSYLHTNCAHCHRMHAGSSVLSKMQYDLELPKTTMLNERPSQGTFSIPSARVIAPGDPYRSVLWYRMSKLGRGRMPHIGSTMVDDAGVELIYDWISQLPATTDSESPATATDDLLAAVNDTDPGSEEQTVAVTQLLSTTTGALRALRAVQQSSLDETVRSNIIAHALAHSDSQVRDLFERFLPEEKRVKRLGSIIKPEQILALGGDAKRGRMLFEKNASVTCRNCHRIDKTGETLGPDLRKVAQKKTAAQLLEGMLSPSSKIEPEFATFLIETKKGRVFTGIVISKTDSEIVLKDASLKETRVPVEQVELMEQQTTSLMPELLLRDMTAQEVADLLAYFTSLK